MKRIIDIDEDLYKVIKNNDFNMYNGRLYEMIRNSTPHETVTEFADRCRECGREKVLDKIQAEITKYEGLCRLSEDEYPSCKECTDNVFGTFYGILDKYKVARQGERG